MRSKPAYPLALFTVLALVVIPPLTSVSIVNAAPSNLVQNASLEEGADWPSCFSRSGWGTEGEWELVPGRTGGRAAEVSITGYASGDRKLLQSESVDCAPQVTPGASYDLGVWYTATVPVHLTIFRHSASGWSYWGDLATAPASASWVHATATTPAVPPGTDQLSFGLSLAANGTLTTDDYSLMAVGGSEPAPANLVANPTLAQGSELPGCFFTAGWGQREADASLSSDVPPGSPAGTRSMSYVVSNYVSGDIKLLPAEAAGCAPAVQSGTEYELSIDYKSSSASNSLTVFKHTAEGWSYWTDIKALPQSAVWTTATATLPEVPAEVDRVSFGISLSSNGSLYTTNYSMTAAATPTPTPTPTPPPGGDAALLGSWQVLASPMPIRTIHTTLLTDGRLLLIAGSGNDGAQFAAGTFRAVVWDPADSSFTEIPTPYDMFCAGHVTLPDGKVLLAGGTLAFPEEDQGPNTFKGSKKSYYFDPADDAFHPLSDMAGAHWYPSLTKLGNGDVWAAGGLDDKAEGTVLTEMFDYSEMSWLPAGSVPQTWSFWGTYPHMYLLDDGMLFYAGAHTFGNGLPGTGSSLYDWRTAQIWDVPGLRLKDLRDQAGSVLLPPAQDQRVMIVGGGNTDSNLPGTNYVDIIDLSDPSPEYVPGPNLPGAGKAYVNTVILPDRTVLASNGARYNRADNVLTAAIYSPTSNSWTSVAPDPLGRNYHSTSILMPDGKVAVLGSNPADNSFEMRISVYSPPYLFAGERPTITAAPENLGYGASITLGVTGSVQSASLMPPPSATHQTDTNARLVDLPLAGTGGTRTAQVPSNPNLLPPGPYMLTVLDSAGVPSVAEWVWVQ